MRWPMCRAVTGPVALEASTWKTAIRARCLQSTCVGSMVHGTFTWVCPDVSAREMSEQANDYDPGRTCRSRQPVSPGAVWSTTPANNRSG